MAKKLYDWRITKIRGSASHPVGQVKAPDAEAAIREAAQKYDIPEEERRRLAAQRRVA
jgi:hypothetical protein